ncbi:MAG: phytanoyl-CoA dioxygenase family protein [Abditibacteriaceae bacterium]
MNNFDIDQIEEDYERDGVVRVRELFSAEQVQEIKDALACYTREIVPQLPEADRVYEADGVSVRNLWRIDEHDAYFRELIQQPFLLEIVSRLVHGEPVSRQVETFNKPARIGSAVPWHQDNAYFCQSPPDMLTVWLAIDAATIENGAIYYVPGSQHELLPHVPSGVDGNSMGVKDPPDVALEKQFCGELKPGDALIHHCQTLHRSEPNSSPNSRLGLLMVFQGAHAQTDPALKAEYEAARN